MTSMAISVIRGMPTLLAASVGPSVRLANLDSCGEWDRECWL